MKVLNFQERNRVSDEVVKACTIDGDYQPALLDVVFRLTILKYFADYDIIVASRRVSGLVLLTNLSISRLTRLV